MIEYKWSRADHAMYARLEEEARGEIQRPSRGEVEDLAMWKWMRWKGSTDLYYFGSEIMGLRGAVGRNGRHRLDPSLHRRMAAEMEREDDTLQLYPRGTMKSSWIKYWCIQKLIQNPMNRIAIWSVTATLVRTELRHIKLLCRTPVLAELWPEIFTEKWQKDTRDEFTMHRDLRLGDDPQDPQITVWGLTGNATGHHYDYQVYDDVINEQNVTSADQIEKVISWYQMAQAIKETTGIEKFIGTRYHQYDIYGHVINERLFDKKNVITIPAEINGKPTYSFWTVKDLDRLKKRMKDNWWPQMMNEPVPMSKRIFKGPYPQYREEHLPQRLDYYITIDPAATVSKTSDYTAIAVAGMEQNYRGMLYFIEVEQYKLHPEEIAEKIVDMIVKYKPKRVGIELGLQQALQYIIDLKIQAREREIRDYIRPTFVEINTRLPGIKSKADKFARTIGAFMRDSRCAFRPDMKHLFRQFDMYNPTSDKNDDDMIDACAMMFQTIEKFSAAHWMNVKEVKSNVAFTWEEMEKARNKDRAVAKESWGWRFAG